MIFNKIYTEDPEQELWQSLMKYSYRTNIEKYFRDHGISSDDGENSCPDSQRFDI